MHQSNGLLPTTRSVYIILLGGFADAIGGSPLTWLKMYTSDRFSSCYALGFVMITFHIVQSFVATLWRFGMYTCMILRRRCRYVAVQPTRYSIFSLVIQGALGKISFTADCWSDPNLMPFMAITAHWSDHHVKYTQQGQRYITGLHSELIAFHCIPHRHTGEHLASVFMSILDHYKIKKVCDAFIHQPKLISSVQIGWIMLDNASNNDTLVSSLAAQLMAQGIDFLSHERHIRYRYFLHYESMTSILTMIIGVSHTLSTLLFRLFLAQLPT